MTVESATYVNDLTSTNPPGTDSKAEGDNHIRLIKAVLKATFPGLAGRAFRRQTKSANYSLTANDNLTVIDVATTGLTITTAVAASTLGNGYMVFILARGFDVTFDPISTEDVDGTTSATIPNGQVAIALCNGTSWNLFYLDRNSLPYPDTQAIVKGSSDATKKARFEADTNIPTATTRVYTLPSLDGTLALTSDVNGAVIQKGYITGLTVSNAAGDLANDLTIAAGSAVDSTGTKLLTLSGTFTKQKDNAFSTGTNQGGFITGSGETFSCHVYLIEHSTTFVCDVCFSGEPTATFTPPTGYGLFRRIATIPWTTSAGVWGSFVQCGNLFTRTSFADDDFTAVVAAANTYYYGQFGMGGSATFGPPRDIECELQINFQSSNSVGSAFGLILPKHFSSPANPTATLHNYVHSTNYANVFSMNLYAEGISDLGSSFGFIVSRAATDIGYSLMSYRDLSLAKGV